MRKKGKDEQEIVDNINKFDSVAIILIFAVAIFIIWGNIIIPAMKPDFKIYKNECHNETIDLGTWQGIEERSECIIYCYSILDNMSKSFMGRDICDSLCSNLEKEVCNLVEVEYMYIENQTMGSCSKWLYYKDGTASCIGKEEWWQEEIWFSSEDLTKKWFDENCDEEECTYGNNKITTCCDEENKCENAEGEIQKYKCFDKYTVEVVE